MANSFSWNGFDMSSLGLVLTSIPQPVSLADSNYELFQLTQRDGASIYGNTLKSKTIQLEVQLIASSKETYITAIDTLKEKLDPRKGIGLLILDAEQCEDLNLNRGYLAKLSSPIIDYRNHTGASFQLSFIVPSGKCVGVGLESQVVSINPNYDEFHVPEDPDDTVGGTDLAEPIIDIHYTGPSGTRGFILSNTTLGTTLTWTGWVESGCWVRFDSSWEEVLKSMNRTTWSLANEGLWGSSNFPRLKHNTRNVLQFSGADSGSIYIEYRKVFL